MIELQQMYRYNKFCLSKLPKQKYKQNLYFATIFA